MSDSPSVTLSLPPPPEEHVIHFVDDATDEDQSLASDTTGSEFTPQEAAPIDFLPADDGTDSDDAHDDGPPPALCCGIPRPRHGFGFVRPFELPAALPLRELHPDARGAACPHRGSVYHAEGDRSGSLLSSPDPPSAHHLSRSRLSGSGFASSVTDRDVVIHVHSDAGASHRHPHEHRPHDLDRDLDELVPVAWGAERDKGRGPLSLWYTSPVVQRQFRIFSYRSLHTALVAFVFSGGGFVVTAAKTVGVQGGYGPMNYALGVAVIVAMTADVWMHFYTEATVFWATARMWTATLVGLLAVCMVSFAWYPHVAQCDKANFPVAAVVRDAPAPSGDRLQECIRGVEASPLVIGLQVVLSLTPHPVHAVALVTLQVALFFAGRALVGDEYQEHWRDTLMEGTVYMVALPVAWVFTALRYRSTVAAFEGALELAQQAHVSQKRGDELDLLLYTLVPEEVLPRLLHTRKSRAHTIDKSTSASMFFADMQGFTRWSSERSPQAVAAMLNTVVARIDRLAWEDDALEKIKTIGDAYWAVAGLPHARRDHADRMAEFALAVIGVVEDANTQHPEWGGVTWRVGVHSGPMCGAVFGTQQVSYEVFGPACRVTQEVERLGTAGRVAATDELFSAMTDQAAAAVMRRDLSAEFTVDAVPYRSYHLGRPDPEGSATAALPGMDARPSLLDLPPLQRVPSQSAMPNPGRRESRYPARSGPDSLGRSRLSNSNSLAAAATTSNPRRHSRAAREKRGVKQFIKARLQAQRRKKEKKARRKQEKADTLEASKVVSEGGFSAATEGSIDSLGPCSTPGDHSRLTITTNNGGDPPAAAADAERAGGAEGEPGEPDDPWAPRFPRLPVLFFYAHPAVEGRFVEFATERAAPVAFAASLLACAASAVALASMFIQNDPCTSAAGIATSAIAVVATLVAAVLVRVWVLIRTAFVIVCLSGSLVMIGAGVAYHDGCSLGIETTALAVLFEVLCAAWVGPVPWLGIAGLAGLGYTVPGAVFIIDHVVLGMQSTITLLLGQTMLLLMIITLEIIARRQFVEAELSRRLAVQLAETRRDQEAVLAAVVPGHVIPDLMDWFSRDLDPARPVAKAFDALVVGFIKFTPKRTDSTFATPRNGVLTGPMARRAVAHVLAEDDPDMLLSSGSTASCSSATFGSTPSAKPESQPATPALGHGTVADAEREGSWLPPLHAAVDAELSRLPAIDKIKTVGDVVMVAGPFRPGVSTGAAADSAIAAAGLLTAAARLQVGLHVGPAMGVVQGSSRLSFDVFGDAVNTASRIMTGEGGPGHLAASTEFVECLELEDKDHRLAHPTWGGPETRAAKGKGNITVQRLVTWPDAADVKRALRDDE